MKLAQPNFAYIVACRRLFASAKARSTALLEMLLPLPTRHRHENTLHSGALLLLCLFLVVPSAQAVQWTHTTLKDFPRVGLHPSSALVQGSDGTFYGTTVDGGTPGHGTVFKISADGQTFTTLYSFGANSMDGLSPHAALVQGSDGAFYGTTRFGGSSDNGTVFRITADGQTFTTLYSFSSDGTDGAHPFAALVQGDNGDFYGTTSFGGSTGNGTVFKITADGQTFSTLYSFGTNNVAGRNPHATLVQGSDGAFYGTTRAGGNSGHGTVFKIMADGQTFTTLYSFSKDSTDGSSPVAALVQGRDGGFYGTTRFGGSNDAGTLFKLSADGQTFTTLYSFDSDGADGAIPAAALVQGRDGALYGTTVGGGSNDSGTVFKLSPDGPIFTTLFFTTLYSFSSDRTDGAGPVGTLVQGRDGAFYGTTGTGGSNDTGTVFRVTADGEMFATLHSFAHTDGLQPIAPLLEGNDGAFYGTTYYGGGQDRGAVFKVSPDGKTFTSLHSFTSANTDGQNPYAALVQGNDGALYGTTSYGGSNDYGTVFRITTDGQTFTTIYSFGADQTDGISPHAALTQGSDGAFYGTTRAGGSSGYGTVFKITADGQAYKTLHSFSYADGAEPFAALVQGSDGAFYGTTFDGGVNRGSGTVFKLSADGQAFTTLHSFSFTDGAQPYAHLVQGRDGALYGTTYSGGSQNFGTIFKVSEDGQRFTKLHEFLSDGAGDGAPGSALLLGRDGAFYGTTIGGISNGSVFKISEDGKKFTTLYSFGSDSTDGARPFAALVQGRDGAFYGTTRLGGSSGNGTVFKLSEPPSDYGDAPSATQSGFASGYPTLQDDNGPRHAVSDLYFGGGVDVDADGQPNATATGDDIDASINDEDGVTFSGLLIGASTAQCAVTVSQANTGKVNAFIDFNVDGDFDDTGEHIINDELVDLTSESIPFSIPATSAAGITYARVRLSSVGGDAPTGMANDGEVEDFQIALALPTLSIADASVTEGDSGTTSLNFIVTLSARVSQEVTFTYSTADGTATTTDGDYAGRTDQTGTITAGQATTIISIPVTGDTDYEDDEGFAVTLSNPSGATIADGSATASIINDDAAPTASPAPSPTSSPTPSPSPSPSPSPIVSPTPSPTASPAPVPSGVQNHDDGTSGGSGAPGLLMLLFGGAGLMRRKRFIDGFTI